MDNGFLDSFIAVLPTIGKVAASLLAGFGNDEKNYLGFFESDTMDANELDKAVFTMEEGRLYLCNTCARSHDEIVLSTPTINNVSETLILPGLSKLDVSDVFEQCINAGGDNFALTASSAENSNSENGESAFTILPEARKVEFSDKSNMSSIRLGNFLQLTWNELPEVYVTSTAVGYNIEQIMSIVISCENYESSVIMPKQSKQDDGSIKIRLDSKIVKSQQYDIRLQAKITKFSNSNMLCDERIEPPLTESDVAKLIRRKSSQA